MSGEIYKPFPISDASSVEERQAILLAMVPQNPNQPSLEQITQGYLKGSSITKPVNTWTFKAGNTTYIGCLKPAYNGLGSAEDAVFEVHVADNELAMFQRGEVPWRLVVYSYEYPDLSHLEIGDEIDIDLDNPRQITREISHLTGPLPYLDGKQPEMYVIGLRSQYALVDWEGNVLTRLAWRVIFQFDASVFSFRA